jgi:hypothetical protein
VLDQRGQLLRAALGFAGLPRPSYDRALWALRTWLDSWRVTLLVDLHAFFQEHRRCGDLDGRVEDDPGRPHGSLNWKVC